MAHGDDPRALDLDVAASAVAVSRSIPSKILPSASSARLPRPPVEFQLGLGDCGCSRSLRRKMPIKNLPLAGEFGSCFLEPAGHTSPAYKKQVGSVLTRMPGFNRVDWPELPPRWSRPGRRRPRPRWLRSMVLCRLSRSTAPVPMFTCSRTVGPPRCRPGPIDPGEITTPG